MQWQVSISGGAVPVLADDEPRGIIVILAHGAGSHMENKTMEWLAGLVRRAGASAVRFNFLYRVQGKSMPDRMPISMATYRSVIDFVRERLSPEKLVIGGHSYGGRVASMVEAEGKTADGLLLFSYPLHPPGQPDKLRSEHLPSITTPTLQFSGTADEFCTPELMDNIMARLTGSPRRLEWIEGASHSYSISKSSGNSRSQAEAQIVSVLKDWLSTL